MEREDRTHKYEEKKKNKQKHSTHKDNMVNEEFQEILKSIKEADLKTLKNFIEKSFDKYADKHEKLYAQMSKEIIKRIPQIVELEKKKFEQDVYKALEKYATRTITKEDYEKVAQYANTEINIEIKVHISSQYHPKFQYKELVFYVGSQAIRKKVCPPNQNLFSNIIYEPTMKRMKKQSLENLENLDNFVREINTVLSQQ